jgi:uncharacterized C2H2 Zn-finger protein
MGGEMPAKTRAKRKKAILFTCPYCGRGYKSKKGYSGHIKAKHPNELAAQKEKEQHVAQNDGNGNVDAPQVPPYASSPVPAQIPQAPPQAAPPAPLQAPQVDMPAIVDAISDGFKKAYAEVPATPPVTDTKILDALTKNTEATKQVCVGMECLKNDVISVLEKPPEVPVVPPTSNATPTAPPVVPTDNTNILAALAENTKATEQVCVGIECLKETVLEKFQERQEQAPAPLPAQEAAQTLEPTPPPPPTGNSPAEILATPPPERPKKVGINAILDHIIHCPDCVKVLKREVLKNSDEVFPNHVLRSKELETPQETQNQTQEVLQDGSSQAVQAQGPPEEERIEEGKPEQGAEATEGPAKEDRTEGKQQAETTAGPPKEEPVAQPATDSTDPADPADSAKSGVLTCPPYCNVRGI